MVKAPGELASRGLTWARSPHGSLALRLEQAPVTDTEETQLKADAKSCRYKGPSLCVI